MTPLDPGGEAKAALEALRTLLADCRTVEVVGWYMNLCLQRANDDEHDGPLMSPARQGDVLLSVLGSTPEPANPVPVDEHRWRQTTDHLNEAFQSYLQLFWPAEGDVDVHTERWTRVRDVAMPAFLNYFNTGLLADPEQVIDRITTYITPFDSQLAELDTIPSSEALAVANWIADRMEQRLAALNATMERVETVRAAALKGTESIADARRFVAQHAPDLGEEVRDRLDELGVIELDAIVAQFGQIGEKYWQSYCMHRGSGPVVTYPTERVIAETHPLVSIRPGIAMVPAINSLWTAILVKGEDALRLSPSRDAFFSHRDKALEREVAREMERILSPPATISESAFETDRAHHEHDVLAVSTDALFIAEAKASPPIEPFRDPERAFTRLKRAFSSDKGIQKGFEQAERIRARLAAGEAVRMHREDGSCVVELQPQVLQRQYSIVVTRDNCGPLATDLALLLEKDENTPYPWAVSILDLRSIADAWRFLGWGTAEFERYLIERTPLNGKLFASDELEIVGYFIQHGSLESIGSSKADKVHLNPHYSDFFDALFRHQRHDGPAPKVEVAPPVLMDMRASLRAGQPVFVDSDGNVLPDDHESPTFSPDRKVGRNETCPCGSGRKFKRCHGAPGRRATEAL